MLGMCRDPPHRPDQPVKRVAARPPPGRQPAAHLHLAAYARAGLPGKHAGKFRWAASVWCTRAAWDSTFRATPVCRSRHAWDLSGRMGSPSTGDLLGGSAKGYAMLARTGRTAALVALIGCAAALAVSGCQVDTGQLKHRAATYAVSSPVHTLVINDLVGDVHVTGGAGRVSVTERITYRHQLPATAHAVRAGTLTLTGTCPAHQPCDIEYHVRVPPGTTVRISERVGNIRLAALTDQVTAHTNAGGIALGSLSGAVQVSDHAG